MLKLSRAASDLVALDWSLASVTPPGYVVFETTRKGELVETASGIGDESAIALGAPTSLLLDGEVPPRGIVYYKVLPADGCGMPVYP